MRRIWSYVALCASLSLGYILISCSQGNMKENAEGDTDTVIVVGGEYETVIAEEQKNEKQHKEEVLRDKEGEDEKNNIEVQPKVEEAPKEIGASPDAVYFLDDSETESTPRYPEGEKALKKAIKNKLRKAKKGEKAKFRASIVIKSDGSVGRVQFTECGYNDEYKAEIVDALKSLPAFEPGMKDGKAVDSWYYLNYKR